MVTLEGSLSVCCFTKQIHFAHARDFCTKVKNNRRNHHRFTTKNMCQPLQRTSVQSLHFSDRWEWFPSRNFTRFAGRLQFGDGRDSHLCYVMNNSWQMGYHADGRGTHSSANTQSKPHRWCRASTTFCANSLSDAVRCSEIVSTKNVSHSAGSHGL